MAGKKFSQGKPKLGLIDPLFAQEMAHVLMMGEEKYGVANWMAGIPWSEMVNSAYRHLAAIELGVFVDPESGRFHGAHVACCMMMLGYYIQNGYGGYNDFRYASHDATTWPPEEPADGPLYKVDPPTPCARDTLDSALERINKWAARVIPNRTAEQCLSKLVMEELPELLVSDKRADPLEWADVLILALDGAQLSGVDPIQAIHAKMGINEKREWAVNEFGVVQHVE